jgi:lipopolysaccharide assembly protein A
MRMFSYLIFLIVMLVGLIFSSLNSTPVVFNYYLGAKTIALSLLLIFTFGIGMLFGILVAAVSWLKVKKDNLQLKSRLKLIEKEVENLRSIPIRQD